MISVRRVTSKKEQKEFIDYPLKLYDGCPYFVPPLYSDEKKMFKKGFVYNDTCEIVCFNAYDEGVMVGRIQGIIQKAANEKNGEKRVRFTRFDAIDSQPVADALFKAVEDWARERGMDTVCGPLGFSDLEREGLLVEGFDQLSTFEEQYNYEYYRKLIENCGYVKEVDWTESKIYPPEKDDGALQRISDKLLKRYGMRVGEAKNVNDFIDRYADGMFELLDKSYEHLYGTVPFTKGMKKLMIDNFRLIIDLEHVGVVLDKDDNIVCIGVCFPSIAEAVQKSKGRLTPAALVRILRAIKHPKVIDLGLVGIDPVWANHGVSVAVSAALERMLRKPGVDHAETNLNLEDNHLIQNQWKRFVAVQHKRRRAFVKEL
ncbi:MAG: N-acetyltransferase [Clostridiales bacterium]|nr:N-acetyltransferase [Clostridiales bacterium]